MNTYGEQRIREIVELVNRSEISSIKKTVKEILQLIMDENSSAKDLKDIIERDPPLCSRLLKRANSASYGYPKTIGDIQEAIVCIGFDAVKELALSQKVCELFKKDDIVNGYSRKGLWKHCSAVAICSKMIYRREFGEHGDKIYVAGLLHDLGIIVEDQFFQWHFEQALEKACLENTNLSLVEKEFLLVDHTEIGRAIAEDWDFPEELGAALGFHHQPDLAPEDFERNVLTVFVADYICQREKIGYGDAPYTDEALFRSCLVELDVREKALGIILEELKEEIHKLEQTDWF
ncbi:MAG: HDOD domain-containing protein [Candidatus Glassbacteria bacterium]|nr:HDOD domain-containing protein [Candidatus Glassbacteria bacterium]